MMEFYEEIGLGRYLYYIFVRREAFFFRTSHIVDLLLRVFPRIKVDTRLVRLNHGNVAHAQAVKKNAYIRALNALDKINLENMSAGKKLFDIDFLLVLRKFLITEIFFGKYEFYELFIKYTEENPGRNHILHIKKPYSDQYLEILKLHGKVYSSRGNNRLRFYLSVILSPVLLWLSWRRNGVQDWPIYEGAIICNVLSKSLYLMYQDLFGSYANTRYIVSRRYLSEFSIEEIDGLGIQIASLTKEGYISLRRHLGAYAQLCYSYSNELAWLGLDMLLFFMHVIQGRSDAPHGRNNLFLTFEHFYTSEAIRNEFIKNEASKTVFFPKNIYPYSLYHWVEIFNNYDILCSSGKHLEELYRQKKAVTSVVLRTGSYDAHKGVINTEEYPIRLQRLKDFKGDCKIITVLSPGICDENYSHELRLMQLAKELTGKKGIRVLVRKKPISVENKYLDFYDHLQGIPNLLLTSSEYELFDLLEITDLFVTSTSSSATEIASAGGTVLYIDFMKAGDMYYFWDVIEGICIFEEDALQWILDWVYDSDGTVRAKYEKRMVELRSYLEYLMPSFHYYKENVIKVLLNKNVVIPQCSEGDPGEYSDIGN